MKGTQLLLDFSGPRVLDDEKRTELISFRVGEKFKHDLEHICRAKAISLSELCVEYVIQGYLEDYKQALLIESRGKRTIKELLLRG